MQPPKMRWPAGRAAPRLKLQLPTTSASPPPSAPTSVPSTPSPSWAASQSAAPAQRAWSSPARLTDHQVAGNHAHLLTFTLEGPAPPVLLLPGQYIVLSPALSDGGRPYTPVGMTARTITCLVKVHAPAAEEPTRGAFARWLTSLPIGHRVQLSGPFGAIALELGPTIGGTASCGCMLHLRDAGVALPVRRLALVAGGSGVTPVVQVLRAACARAEGGAVAGAARTHTSSIRSGPPMEISPLEIISGLEIWVVISEKSPEHSLLRDELDALHARHPTLVVSLHRTFTALSTETGDHEAQRLRGASVGTGRINAAMLRARLPPPAADTVVLVSGPAGFEAAVQCGLDAAGHVHSVLLSSSHVHSAAVPKPDQRPSTLSSIRAHGAASAVQGLAGHWLPALRCCVPSAIDRPLHKQANHGGVADELLCA